MGNVGFTTIDMIILIVYLLVVLVAGLLFSKKEMQGKEFFKGDGTRLSPFLVKTGFTSSENT